MEAPGCNLGRGKAGLHQRTRSTPPALPGCQGALARLPGALTQGPAAGPGRSHKGAISRQEREPQADSLSATSIRPRSCNTALVWIWHTRLSVTPRTWPISASVSPS